MSSKKTKLELTWIGKEHRPKLEPRILLEEPDKSHHAKHRVSDGDLFDNRLIRGDNLLGLKALEQEFAGKVKCVFIDPPYNTGSAFEHYDDGLEHSIWLSLMRDRLGLLRALMSSDGSIWITLDDNEAHYLKVLCDEVFGRVNFLADVIWEKADSPRSDAKFFSSRHDHILVYAKDIEKIQLNRLKQAEAPAHYSKKDSSGRIYYLKPLRAMGADGHREKRPSMYFPLIAPDGSEVFPKNADGSDSRWQWGLQKVEKESDRIEFVKTKDGWSAYFRIFFEDTSGRPPETIWTHGDVGSNRTSKKEIKDLFVSDVFDTPKPEALIYRVLEIGSNPGDLVLDSFLGSGTTAAVAHKMGRRWIGIELGEHCETHCLPRLKKVVDGEDPGGITQAVGWKGGGGFRYYRLAPSLLENDKWGNWVVSKQYNAAMLAEAVCKLEGFSYEPSDSLYWQHGHSTERDFIYTTTANLSHDQLQELSDEVGQERSLLVVCSAFRSRKEGYPNLTVKKIPNAVLTRCEWGKDDYSLKVENLPKAPPEPGQQELF
ncbi:MAG: site-specific DNA-methyltransferase [Verrucomicrobiota bacterium]